MVIKQKSKKKSIKSKDLSNYISIIEQTHRFVLAGHYEHLYFMLKCSIKLIDASEFDTDLIKDIYTDVINSIKDYLKCYPIDFRPTTKEEFLKIKRDMNNTLANSINITKYGTISTITINSLNLWDAGNYKYTLKF
jgi:hypothetical protein